MADDMKLYLFGDQTFDVGPHLKELLRNRDDPILESFLLKAYKAVRREMYSLSPAARENAPRISSPDDLAYWKQGSKRCVPLDMAVTCIYQLASFLSQADKSDAWSHGAAKARTVGICTGALAAAAVSSSSSASHLVHLAVDAVIVAFRIGLHVSQVAERTALPSANEKDDASWSMAIAGSSSAVAAAVEEFNKQCRLPVTSHAYISAYAPNGSTVSGPPSTLARFADSPEFKKLGVRSVPIPIFGPYHAPHLHTTYDIGLIVGTLASESTAARNPGLIRPISSTTASKAQDDDPTSSFRTLMQAAVAQILLQPIRWSSILDDLQESVQAAGPKSFSVVPVGTVADQLVYTALKKTPLASLLPTDQMLAGMRVPAVKDAMDSKPSKPKLAIVAMSGRFPDANNNQAFWDLLYQGLDVHKEVPALHWDVNTHVDPTGQRKNTSAARYGCWLDDPAGFDARFFNISPREAPQIDPAQRLALMTAYEAIEQAGIVPDATPSTRRDRVGVYYGVTSNDWMETNSAQGIDTYFIPGGNRAFIPGRINYCFKFSGPSYAVDTACSSSLAGIHLACNALWKHEIDTAIAGGTNVLTNPDFTSGLDRGHFLSRTGNCKTFDDAADGYCRGEGIGTIIVKRLDDAIAEKDPILAVILGADTNHSAESESITRPHAGAQHAIFSKILHEGGVDPYTVSYVEMHGTGTQAGDAGEMTSVLETFAPAPAVVKKLRSAEERLYIGSAKANIGHGEAASGVSGLIKVLLMMQKNMIVPHCGIKGVINRKFPKDLRERNVHIALEATPWERSADPSKPRRSFVNNFSAAGGNTALLIEDAPYPAEFKGPADPRTVHVVAVSAKQGVSLQANLRSMLGYLKENPQVALGELSYTSTARRIHHPHRVMLSGANVEAMTSQIEKALAEGTGMTRAKAAPKVVFAFTGQGAQYPGMGKQLFETFSTFNNELRRLDQISQSLGFTSFLPLIESEEQDIHLFDPIAVQLASVCFQIALTKLWMSWGITPTAVVGHSLGEYAAMNVAKVLSDSDAIYLIGMRARLLAEKCTRNTHSMLVVKSSAGEIAQVLKDTPYETACVNSRTETVLAGSKESIAVVGDLITKAGMKSTMLHVPYAFHSSQMDPILSEFAEVAGGITFAKAQIPILNTLEGSHGEFDAAYLADHTRQAVNMEMALQSGKADKTITDATVFLEIGPHPAVTGMVRSVLGDQMTCIPSSQRGRPIWQVVGTGLKTLYQAGSDIRWAEYQRDFVASHKVLQLPSYAWDLKPYWMQYVNDWSLRKGDAPLVVEGAGSAKLESTTIHRLVEEDSDDKKARIVVEADIARDDLSPLVQGHEVDGIPLCTPSIYADIALTLGNYLAKRHSFGASASFVDVTEMIISKALILKAGATSQMLQAHGDVDLKAKTALVKFMSFDAKQKLQEHARCTLRFTDKSVQKALQKDAATVKAKMQALRSGVGEETTSRFNRAMAYRAIRPLARFHDDYRAIDEIVLNSKTLEASSKLSYGTVKRGGTFYTHPAIIDSLTQSCGFAMNCNDGTDLDNEVFMNHGWGSMQLFEPIEFDKVYTTYTRMVEGKDKLWYGDVVIFDGEKVAAFLGKVAIQGVPRRVLKVILSIESGQKGGSKAPAPKAAAKAPAPAAKAAAPVTNGVRAAAPAPAPVAVEAAAPAASAGTWAKALEIIADESGIAVPDLTDGTVFGDVGIDSLLGLTIASRIKEDLDMDLDFNALFYEYPTVGDLKGFFGASSSAPIAAAAAPISTAASSNYGADSPRSVDTGITTPESHSGASDYVGTSKSVPAAGKVDFGKALAIISEESGVDVADLTDDTNFADAGIDSLLSLVIVSRYREELELDLQHESLFLECPTVADLRVLLNGSVEAPKAAPAPRAVEVAKAAPEPVRTAAPAAPEPAAGKVDFNKALEIISEESGVDVADLTDDTNFADAGIDSLLSLVIVSRYREELELDLQHESLFLECPTVADLRLLLSGSPAEPAEVAKATGTVPTHAQASTSAPVVAKQTEADLAVLASRKKAVLDLVKKYTAGFSGPTSTESASAPNPNEKVVLVTGASGSLGGNLTYFLAHLPDVKTIVCLNRENKEDPYVRQQKAMRGKGLRFPENLKHKLLVYQTDSGARNFGLPKAEYDALVGSVTHLVHQAWPMSAKRALPGFEPQFQVMRNLIDFACDAASARPSSFKFNFQMVSSVGVVGHYGKGNGKAETFVPEEPMDIDTVLPNGYGEAKWGCELMVDETLHKHPERIRPMVVRLGQIAGSRTSGYWNPMEHFGFLIKSSQTLKALPDVPGTVYWASVNDIAGTLADLVLADHTPHRFYHIENPVGQPWPETTRVLADALGIQDLIPFEDWVERVKQAPPRNNPASTLLEFLDDNYLRMSCGGLVLGVKNTLQHSPTLNSVGRMPEEVIRKYIHVWREIGFIQ